MPPRTVGSVRSTKVSDGLYVVSDAYVRIYDFFETSPLFPGEPVGVPTASAEENRVPAAQAQPAQPPR